MLSLIHDEVTFDFIISMNFFFFQVDYNLQTQRKKKTQQ